MSGCQNGNSGEDSAIRASASRILDANLNRAAEGLRVVEEYARFVIADALLARGLKESRHTLMTAAGHALGDSARLVFRDTRHDVGTAISTDAEGRRPDLESVAAANFKRVEQALRSLEEYGKVLSPEFGKRCEAIRYQIYSLEQATLGSQRKCDALSRAQIYVLLDGKPSMAEFECAAEAIASHADVIQLRDKKLSDRELLERARRLRSITRKLNCLFIVNDRPDLAVLAEADGVHVGQEELGVAEARRIVGERALIGVSTHNIEQLRKAVFDGASYLGCGPVFASQTKSFDALAGLDFLRQAAAETSLPCFAIGGIGLENVEQVADAGFTRIAVRGAIESAKLPPAEMIAELRRRLGGVKAPV